MTDRTPSGEISLVILSRLSEVATEVKDMRKEQSAVLLSLNDGKHRMNDLEARLAAVEKNGCQKGKSDEESDWSKPSRHRSHQQREVKTEPIAKKVDLAIWIKYGAMIGAAVAGAYMAVKSGVGAP